MPLSSKSIYVADFCFFIYGGIAHLARFTMLKRMSLISITVLKISKAVTFPLKMHFKILSK